VPLGLPAVGHLASDKDMAVPMLSAIGAGGATSKPRPLKEGGYRVPGAMMCGIRRDWVFWGFLAREASDTFEQGYSSKVVIALSSAT
jgi:hypothetical protein